MIKAEISTYLQFLPAVLIVITVLVVSLIVTIRTSRNIRRLRAEFKKKAELRDTFDQRLYQISKEWRESKNYEVWRNNIQQFEKDVENLLPQDLKTVFIQTVNSFKNLVGAQTDTPY